MGASKKTVARMKFEIIVDKRALEDIIPAVEYYENISIELGNKFKIVLDNNINTIKTNPFFAIRYKDVRCLYIKKFPFMIHFSVNEIDKVVKIHSVLHTSRNPNIWKNRLK